MKVYTKSKTKIVLSVILALCFLCSITLSVVGLILNDTYSPTQTLEVNGNSIQFKIISSISSKDDSIDDIKRKVKISCDNADDVSGEFKDIVSVKNNAVTFGYTLGESDYYFNAKGFNLRKSSKVEYMASGSTQTVSYARQIKSFRDSVNNGESYSGVTIQLGLDINLSGEDWQPIGYDEGHTFRGIFDGDGKTIKNFKITRPKDYLFGTGFFGFISSATIKNLKITDATIQTATEIGYTKMTYGYGILVGYVGCVGGTKHGCSTYSGLTVKECEISDSQIQIGSNSGVYPKSLLVGGLIGASMFRTSIEDCYVNADITIGKVILTNGYTGIGGIIGGQYYNTNYVKVNYNGDFFINRCIYSGKLSFLNQTGVNGMAGILGTTACIQFASSGNVITGYAPVRIYHCQANITTDTVGGLGFSGLAYNPICSGSRVIKSNNDSSFEYTFDASVKSYMPYNNITMTGNYFTLTKLSNLSSSLTAKDIFKMPINRTTGYKSYNDSTMYVKGTVDLSGTACEIPIERT